MAKKQTTPHTLPWQLLRDERDYKRWSNGQIGTLKGNGWAPSLSGCTLPRKSGCAGSWTWIAASPGNILAMPRPSSWICITRKSSPSTSIRMHFR